MSVFETTFLSKLGVDTVHPDDFSIISPRTLDDSKLISGNIYNKNFSPSPSPDHRRLDFEGGIPVSREGFARPASPRKGPGAVTDVDREGDFVRAGDGFSVAHVNIRGLRKRVDGCPRHRMLTGYLLRNQILVCGVVETRLGAEGRLPGSAFYEWVPGSGRSRRVSGGGVALAVHHSVPFRDLTRDIRLDFQSCFEFCCIACTIRGRCFGLVSVYLPQEDASEIRDFSLLCSHLQTLAFDSILFFGDWNCWHHSWGSADINTRGRRLFSVFSSFGIVPSHMYAPTRFGAVNQRDTVVDFFAGLGCNISDLDIGVPLADHAIISAKLSVGGGSGGSRRRVYDFRRSWEFRRSELESFFDTLSPRQLFVGSSFDDVPHILNGIILRGWDEFGVVKFVNSSSRPWFTINAKRARRQARFWERQRKRASRGGPRAGVDVVECEMRRKSSWDDYWREVAAVMDDCDDFSGRLLDGDVFGTVKRLYGRRRQDIPSLKTRVESGFQILATTDQEKADVFNKKFLDNCTLPADFPIDSISDGEVRDRMNFELLGYFFDEGGILRGGETLGSTIITDEIFSGCECAHNGVVDMFRTEGDFSYDDISCSSDPFCLLEVRRVRRGLKKGVGSVGINNDHIRKFRGWGIDYVFLFVFNLFFSHGYWPLEWRSATIFPLVKGGARDAWKVDDYRGISLVDTIGKFFDRLIYLRLHHICVSQISRDQSGGLARNGSVQQIIRVVGSAQAMVDGTDYDERGREVPLNHVVLALLDCSKAFDRMYRPRLLDKIFDMGVRGRLFISLVAFYFGRRQRVRVGTSFSWIKTIIYAPM